VGETFGAPLEGEEWGGGGERVGGGGEVVVVGEEGAEEGWDAGAT